MVKVGEIKYPAGFCVATDSDYEGLIFNHVPCSRKDVQEIVKELVEWLAETAPKEASTK
jgi:predicted ATP-grasp superfamily ATP-dependent carboligase